VTSRLSTRFIAAIFVSATSAYAWKAWAREQRRSIIIIREAPSQKVAIKPDLVTFRAALKADIAEARTKITEPKAEILNRPSLGRRRFRFILLPFRSPAKAEPVRLEADPSDFEPPPRPVPKERLAARGIT
jgi:hypothetical protein